ncbi:MULTISPECIES: hypothetical protein [Streptomyces]|uniref:Uncharacterized protein n=1 Tax=Streptomyces albus TaxID=1888 RepID=A0A6C1BZD1_9ACTN|nr:MULTISPECIES: hypothetical protein [Streptomyces]MDI6412193.1 hypothetical protein [Streptomyces albus]QID35017.1 hypothetical protein G3260_000911 [Streptomyces albus]TGG76298.1 hypothetical protein D8771_30305 [Streptomyces albus]UVN58180.1 hypothetical protein NR995_29375 [Streptomyces albus]
MSDDTPRAPAARPRTRYFAKAGGGFQAVHNLRDTTAYRKLGYEEIDEPTFLASLPDPADDVCTEHLTD